MESFIRIAVLDDYQGVALAMADWDPVRARCRVDVFTDHLADVDEVAGRLLPYDVICVMRERTPLRRELLQRLPRLKLICSTAGRNASIDVAALIEALATRRIAGAAVDVYDVEPLPPDDPLRRQADLLATPHIGYVSQGLYRRFYSDTVRNILVWLDRRPPQGD